MNQLLEKIALNALARRLQDRPVGTSLSVSHEGAVEDGKLAYDKVGKKNAGNPDVLNKQIQAAGNATKRQSSSSVVRTLGLGKGQAEDVLAMTNIRERLLKHKQNLGLAPAQDKAQQIRNANALREANSTKGLTKNISASGRGTAGSQAAQTVNQALVNERQGVRSHLSLNSRSGTASLESITKHAPAAVPKTTGLLDRARSILKSPMAKKIGIGAGVAAGLGAAFAYKKHKEDELYPTY